MNVGGDQPVEKAAAEEAEEIVADLLHRPPGGPARGPAAPGGMHRSDTIDIAVVVSGELTVEAGDGTTTVLGPGDVYVQNGAMHSCSEPEDPAHVVFIVLGAERAAARSA